MALDAIKVIGWMTKTFFGMLLSVLIGGGATAGAITFTDVYDPTNVTLDGTPNSVSFTHDILNSAGDPQGDAYNPGIDQLTSGSLALAFIDGDSDGFFCSGECEFVTIGLDGVVQFNNFLLGNWFEVGTSTTTIGVNLSMLQNGLLNVTITRTSGDVTFDKSILTVDANRSSIPAQSTGQVPEPASFVFLGLGLIGTACVARRRKGAA